MARTPSREHEAMCRRCGSCCYEKVIIDDRVFQTRKPCEYLDEDTMTCTVYDRRFRVNPRCLDVPKAIACHVFPADCPYVADLDDYVPPVAGWLEVGTLRKIARGALLTCEDVIADMRRSRPSKP